MTDAVAQDKQDEEGFEQKLMAIYQRLQGMNDMAPDAAEQTHRWIKEQCADPRIAKDLKTKLFEKARALNCNVHMRATGEALTVAARLATEGRMTERSSKLTEANILYGKACALGADDQFRRATGRLIETVMMTGNKRHTGPVPSRPHDTAHKNPH